MTACTTNHRLSWLVAWPIAGIIKVGWFWKRAHHRGIGATLKTGAHAAPPAFTATTTAGCCHSSCTPLMQIPQKRKRGKGASTGCVPGLRGGTCSGTWKKWYWSWCLIEHLFIYEGRLVMTSRNWLHCQWWHCMTSCMTRHTITTSVAMTIRRLPWLVAQQVVWPVCDLLQFGITEHEFWTWPSTLLRLIFL